MADFWAWLTQPSALAVDPATGLYQSDIPANEWNALTTEWNQETQTFIVQPAQAAATSAGAAVGSAFTLAAQNTANAVAPAATSLLLWGGAALVGFLAVQRLQRR